MEPSDRRDTAPGNDNKADEAFSGNRQLPTFRPGDLLCDRFRVVRFIARGGMGELYEAEDLELAARIGQGGSMGGVQWGSAADGERVYVALSDLGRVMLAYTQFTDADRQRGGGMAGNVVLAFSVDGR